MERAGIRWEDWDLSRGAAALRPVIEQVYTYYGQLYLDHPELEWAGLANLVGPSFAGGFLDLSMLREFADRVGGPFDDLPGPIRSLLPPPLNGFAELTSFGEGEIGWYEHQFLDMQRQIFLDMGSMNRGGVAAIDEMYDAGLFEMSDNPSASESTYRAWRDIDEATRTGDQQLLHDAAKSMAYREQHDIIQDDYAEMHSHFPSGPAVTKLLTAAGQVSVPDTRTMGEYAPTEVTASVYPSPVPFGPHAEVTVRTPWPRGDVSSFEDRWDYFTNDTFPAYTALLQDQQRTTAEISGNMHDRIEDYRLVHRMDDLVRLYADGTEVTIDGEAW